MRYRGIDNLLAVAASTLMICCAANAWAQSPAVAQAQGERPEAQEKLEKSLRFCAYEMERIDGSFNTFSTDAWSTVPKHMFHCHMMFRAERLLLLYKQALVQSQQNGPDRPQRALDHAHESRTTLTKRDSR